MKCIKMLTFLPMDQIRDMEKWDGGRINEKKEILAYELTKLVHGEEEAQKALASARALFTGGSAAELPATPVSAEVLRDGKADVLSLLVASGLEKSRRDARRDVEQGVVEADGAKVESVSLSFDEAQLREGVVLRRGKKNYRRVVLK